MATNATPTQSKLNVPADMAACGAQGVADTDECDVCGPVNDVVYYGITRTRHFVAAWTLCAHHVVCG